MNLIDKQHIVLLQRCQDACQVPRLVQYGAAGNLESYSQFVGNNIRQRRLTQSRRTVQQDVIQRFATVFGSLDEHLQVLHYLLLTAEVMERQRSQSVFELFFARTQLFLPDVKIFVHHTFLGICLQR